MQEYLTHPPDARAQGSLVTSRRAARSRTLLSGPRLRRSRVVARLVLADARADADGVAGPRTRPQWQQTVVGFERL